MASSEAFRPITTLQEPGLLGMPRTYTSQREVAAETEPPARGSVLGNILGPQFAAHVVLDASIQPKDGKRILSVSHCSAPAWTTLLGSGDRQDGLGEHLYSQQVVPTPTQSAIEADTLSSYQPIDEAKSLKRTKKPRRKKTDGTFEDGYPQQQVKAIGSENPPPQRYRRQSISNETATTETLPSANVNDIPDTAYLSGNQTKIVHQKLNDDQYRKTVTEQTLALNTSSVDESVERKPFVSIKSTMTPGSSISLAATGNASSRLVYENGDTKIYENVAEVATARPGPAGTEKDEKPFVRLTSNKKYSTSPEVATATGSSNVVFNDGSVRVYEVSEVTATAKTGLKGVETDAQQWGSLKTTTNYTTSDNAPSGGSVQLVYDGGSVKIYEASTPSVTTSGSTTDIDANAWGKLTWKGTYAKSTSGDKSRQVWSNGVDSVYLNETATLQPEGGTEETDANSWGSIAWNGTYSKSANAGSNGKSRQVYSGPGGSVYLNETPQVRPLAGAFQSAKKTTPTYTVTETTSFSTSSEASEPNSQTRLVFAQGTERVFEKTVRTIEPKGRKIYYSVINAQTPSRLKQLLIEKIKRKPNSEGPVRDKICIRADIEEGYSGLFPAKITEYFTKDPAAAENFKPLVFKTKRVDYDGIQFQVSIGETLHEQVNLVDTIGTNDPDYVSLQKLSTSFTHFTATEPTRIPTGWQNYAIQIDPFEDGYLVKEIQVKYTD